MPIRMVLESSSVTSIRLGTKYSGIMLIWKNLRFGNSFLYLNIAIDESLIWKKLEIPTPIIQPLLKIPYYMASVTGSC